MTPRDTSPAPPPTDLLSVNDLSTQFGVSHDWVYKRVSANAKELLPFLRIGRLIRFRREDVRSYLEVHQRGKTNGSLLATDGIARADGRRKRSMARKRFQKGHVRLRNTTNPYCEAFYWTDLRFIDNRLLRKQRAINLPRSPA